MEDEAYLTQPNTYSTTVTRYGLGARGINFMEGTVTTGGTTGGGTTTTAAFPVYDGRGNMVATLSRSGNNSYTLGNQRSFDAWGNVRLGAGTGDPTGRYCANLGHKQDDESGLIYMRARYYEPTSGRFVSQDPARYGENWFVFCSCDPTNCIDPTGKFTLAEIDMGQMLNSGLISGFVGGTCSFFKGGSFWEGFIFGFITGAAGSIGYDVGECLAGYLIPAAVNAACGAIRAIMHNKGPGNVLGRALLGAALGSLGAYIGNNPEFDWLNAYEIGAATAIGNEAGQVAINAKYK